MLLALIFSLAACGQGLGSTPSGKSQVVATTTIVGDVVKNIAGESAQVEVLMPIGSDPHSFQPTPQDVAKVAHADLIFANGAGLETFLQPMLQNAGSKAEVVPVSQRIPLLQSQELDIPNATQSGGKPAGDPHTWLDPQNVITWTLTIEQNLIQVDPAHTQAYTANAEAYRAKLRDLDSWIRQQVDQIPPENRRLVTGHVAFTYFAKDYGFQQIGAVIPAYSTLAEPSAQDVARLEDTIRKLGVKAIFVEEAANPALSERVARDTGAKLVQLYIPSLTSPNGPAPTYLDLMRYDVKAIVEALK